MFENLYRIVTGERSIVTPSPQASIEASQPKAVNKIKFAHDIQALKDAGYMLSANSIINLTLQDALTILPRNRRRVDAYKALADYLRLEFGTSLILTSQKNRNKKSH